jgi:hypothetical protein
MNSTLEEIWAARAAITNACHNNSAELVAYYQERQKAHNDRLVRPEKRDRTTPEVGMFFADILKTKHHA